MKNRETSGLSAKAIAPILIATALCLASFASCAQAHSPTEGAAALIVSCSSPDSRTVVPDFTTSVAKYSVALSIGGIEMAAQSDIAYGENAAFEGLAPGDYAVSVNGFDSLGLLAARGSSSVSLVANGTRTAVVALTFSQIATTGGFSLLIEWPVSTNLAYTYASLDGGATPLEPTVTKGSTYYTATYAQASILGGSHILSIYFKTAAGATTVIGPYLESVNIWDGVKSDKWLEADGSLKDRRSFLTDEFPDSDVSLAGFSLSAPTVSLDFAPGTASYSIYSSSATTLSFAATLGDPGQAISYTWNGVAQSWDSVAATGYASTALTVDTAISNVLVVDVIAPDRQSHQAYTLKLGTTMATFDATSSALNLSDSLSAADLATLQTSLQARTTAFTLDLSDATLPSNTLDSTFSNIDYLTAITLPSSCTAIGNSALSFCNGLTSIVIPNSVTSISANAIFYLPNLTTITIPSSVTSMEINVFSQCAKLTDVNVDPANTAYSSVDGVVYNKAQTKIVHYPHAKTATSYTVLGTVTEVGSMAFYSCSSLESIDLPAGLTTIDSIGFSGCGITAITLPSSLLSIGGSAFSGCSGLTALTIPASVTSIGSGAFGGCSSLTAIGVDSGNLNFSSLDGALYNKTQTSLYGCPGGTTSYTFPASVTTVIERAFSGCSKLTALTVPSTVSVLGALVGGGGGGYYTFFGCTSLATIILPSTISRIPYCTFQNCKSLTSIDIPSSITTIEGSAFLGCSSLATVTCYPSTAPTLGSSAFTGTSASLKIYVPTASHASYATNWSAYSAYLVDY